MFKNPFELTLKTSIKEYNQDKQITNKTNNEYNNTDCF